MSISSRIHDTVEDWIVDWRDRLRGWMASWVVKGTTEFMDGLEPEARESMRTTLEGIRDYPQTPPVYAPWSTGYLPRAALYLSCSSSPWRS